MTSLTYSEHFKQNLKIAIPVCLSQSAHLLVGAFDSIMVGGLGKASLAASALSNSIFSLPLIFGIGISFGMTPLIAAADGEKDYYSAGQVFKHGFYINLITGLILCGLFYSLTFAIDFLGQPKEVALLTIPYFKIYILSLIPLMVFQTFKQFAEGLSLTKQAMFISFSGNIIDIVLNYALIYGKLGFPRLGLNGAATSTLIARIIIAGGMGLFILLSPRVRPYIKNLGIYQLSRSAISKVLGIGIPSAFQFLFEITAFATAAIMMGWIGTKELAAHQIAISLAGLTYMFATGFSSGAVVRVGNYFGMKDKRNLRMAGFISFVSVAIFMGVCAITFITANELLPAIYIKDQDVIAVAKNLLIVAAFFQISDGVQVVGLGALRGLTDVKMPTIITFIAYWIIGLPTAYLLSKPLQLGAIGIWIGLLIGLSVSAILLFSRFNALSRRLTFPGLK